MNDYRAYVECDYNSIYHHGIKGQKWGVRRYQNEDGTRTEAGKKRYGGFHIHFDPVSWIAGIASKNSGERLTSIKVAEDKNNGDSLFIDSLLFIPYNVAKRSINNSRERKKLVNNKHENTNKEIAVQRKNLQSKSQEAWNKIEEYRSKKGIEYGDDDLKLYNSDSKYKKIVDEAESIDKELREFDKKNRR